MRGRGEGRASRIHAVLASAGRDRLEALRQAFWTALIPGGLLFAAMQAVLHARSGMIGADSHAYWAAARNPDTWYTVAPQHWDAYLYSPAFAQALMPLGQLPWPVFQSLWAVAQSVTLLWLLSPLGWWRGLTACLFITPELLLGNVYIFFAAALVTALGRAPGALALPLLTKVVPGTVGLWFLVRRDWRGAAWVAGTTLLLVGISAAAAPDAWLDWLHFLSVSAQERGPLESLRLAAALLTIVYAARSGRAWLLAPALVLACPVWGGGYGPLAVLASMPRLLPLTPALRRGQTASRAVSGRGPVRYDAQHRPEQHSVSEPARMTMSTTAEATHDERSKTAAPDFRQPVPWPVRWVPLAGLVVLMLSLSRHAGMGVSDPDTLWHVLAGQHLMQSWSFAGPDPLATFTIHPFVMHQWLPDLVMALTEQAGGLAAVAWLAQLGRIGVCVSIFILCRRWASPLPAAVVTGLAVLGTAESLSPRPQLVGFIFLAVTVDAWLRTAEDGLPRWWLVPLTWVWACSHGTWVIGLMVAGVVIVGMLADRVCTISRALRYGAIPAASLVAAALTPLGPRLFESFLTIREVSPYIQEWRRTTPDSWSAKAVLALAAVTAVIWLARRRQVPWTHLGLFALGIGWAAAHMRTVAVGAIILAPLAAAAMEGVLGRPRIPFRRRELVAIGVGAVASLGMSAALAAAGPQQPTGVPDGLNYSLARLPPGTVVYNTDLVGGWLMWSHPGLRNTSDTRVELYGASRAREYIRVMNAADGWEQPFNRFHAGAALIEERSGLAAALHARQWKAAGSDGGYLLLLPPSAGLPR